MRKPRILVACELSGVVRNAFQARGFDAVSCDLEPSELPGDHIQGDILDLIASAQGLGKKNEYDVLIAFPPCTHLATSGAAWFEKKRADGRQQQGIDFFMEMVRAPGFRYRAIENPIGIMSTVYRKPDQIIHPWQFGHPQRKATCLWLEWLPKLVPTNIVEKEPQLVFPSGKKAGEWWKTTWGMNPKDRAKARSKTFQGIADAMAQQWGDFLLSEYSKEGPQ